MANSIRHRRPTLLGLFFDTPGADFDFDHADWVDRIRPSERIRIDFRQANVVEQALLDKTSQRASRVFDRIGVVHACAFEQVKTLRAPERGKPPVNAFAEVVGSVYHSRSRFLAQNGPIRGESIRSAVLPAPDGASLRSWTGSESI